MYNHLPKYLKEIPTITKFKKTLYAYLTDHGYYTVNEYFK